MMRSHNLFHTLLLAAALTVSLAGCDPYSQDDYEQKYVVQAYLVANEPLPQLRLSTTSPINATYRFEDVAVTGASVEIWLLDAQGNRETAYAYDMLSPGVYTPRQTGVNVLPLRTYELHARVGSDPEITARTLVPDQFDVLDTGNTRITYQGAEQFQVNITRSSYPGRQNIYVFSIATLDPENAELTPFYADLFDDEGDREDVYVNQSGIVFEGNYEVDPVTNSLQIKLPWIALAFYGANRVTANVIDDALYDFIRTRDVQLGGSTLSPGEINNVRTNVNNGIGVFGSYARSSVDIVVEK